ncbi:DUF5000 domain-containing lipoprotein [Snuella sedimenti]|uniref:DUF4959 domain-containing protein n=1 Tax=Snuella sedimenti TaxID=2798802 RepID=A0A8J7IT39_9FLAO|nr:DUF5000 domain-containing lipoprotein [Snuella sedimenti]MBJ6367460.1 DUF4959 domain-containing protein [Snuella sedimenti]
MKQLTYICCTAILLIVVVACTKTDVIGPVENDGKAPGPVSNIQVENLAGKAILTYTLPEDSDVLSVKAVYTTEGGVEREAKSSYYTNKVALIGFGAAKPYEVKVYAVDKGENASEPVSVTVNPLEPPYQIVGEELEIGPDFGGLFVSFENPEEENIAIVVLANDTLGNFIPYNTFYTKLEAGRFSTRGFDPVESDFGVYVRDRWGNISDTTMVRLTPFFEELIDKSGISGYTLPNDAVLGYSGDVDALFTDDVTEGSGYYHSGDAAAMPQWFTFDLGKEVKLSRLAWWMRSDGTRWLYSLHNPRDIEIWGSNNPAPDGSWDSWDLLIEYEQIKPSGLPNGQLTNDDLAAAEAGETVAFPLDTPPYRYIRFKTLRNWSNGTYVNFNEITVWGQPQN